MAQIMLVMSSISVSTSHVVNLKRVHPFLHFQAQGLKPKPFSRFLFSPLSNTSVAASSSTAFTTFVLFKSKTKAAPKKVVPKPKSKVEDGIFGTAGGIGFTKQNELFVGRVAMIGFAVGILIR